MSVPDTGRGRIDTDRWLKPIVAVLAIAAGYFGLQPYLLPELGAQLSGFVGEDIYFYRLTGAASFGYTIALAVGWRDGWRGLRIPIATMAVFAVGSLIGSAITIIAGEATWLVWIVLTATAVFLVLQLLLLTNPPMLGEPIGSGTQDVADWVPYLLAFGGVAAVATGGLALALGGTLGTLGGYSGTDSFVYRQGGAAILGYAPGVVLGLRSRRWAEIRGAAAGALAFNGLSLIATLLELIRPGGLNLITVPVLAVSLVVTIGLALALRRAGR